MQSLLVTLPLSSHLLRFACICTCIAVKLVEMVEQLLMSGSRLLVCCPQHVMLEFPYVINISNQMLSFCHSICSLYQFCVLCHQFIHPLVFEPPHFSYIKYTTVTKGDYVYTSLLLLLLKIMYLSYKSS